MPNWFKQDGTVPSAEAQAEMDAAKERFLAIPRERWNGPEVPLPEQHIAVLCAGRHVVFSGTTVGQTGKRATFGQVETVVRFTWGYRAVAWLPMGD
jgi:hypothetical protein